jgi:hypoxanthine phosphoribosyltransferase
MEMKKIIGADQIAGRVAELSSDIYNHYNSLEVDRITVVPVMLGAMIFASDLVRALGDLTVDIKPMRAKSYRGESPGPLTLDAFPKVEDTTCGKHVLVVEDIFDTGKTLEAVLAMARRAVGPAGTVRAAVLLDKAKVPRPAELAHIGYKIGEKFVIGYGLDLDGLHRNLSDIYEMV